ncbi:MAG TPA: hypothetical protein VFA50_13295 [Stellaceae bacterium]|nr:hypothetical protein [Stellaceae bacterium]
MPETTEAAKRARWRRRSMRAWFGRPSQAQLRLLDRLLAALVVDFEEGGPDAVRKLRDKDPLNYLRIIAVMMPRSLLERSAGIRVQDEDIADAIAEVRAMAAAHAASLGKCIEGTGAPEPPAAVPALPQADRVP